MPDEREQRNAVFSGGQPIETKGPQVSVAEKLKADFGYELPVELVPLPSGGKVYPKTMSFCDQQVVEIKAMTAREEDILTNRALLKKGTVITELIKSCLIDKSVNVNDLLVGDRNALMVAIRATGYGAEYDAEVECNACNEKSSVQFNLASLPIKPLEIEPMSDHSNLFKFTLPKSKIPVCFRFLTGHDETEMSAMQEKQKKLGPEVSSSVTTSLLYSIVSVNGVEDRAKIGGFVRSMHAMDSKELRGYIKKHEPGIVMEQEVECSRCGHSESVGVPISTAFFWPRA